MIPLHPVHLGIIIWGAFALYKKGYEQGRLMGRMEYQVYSLDRHNEDKQDAPGDE